MIPDEVFKRFRDSRGSIDLINLYKHLHRDEPIPEGSPARYYLESITEIYPISIMRVAIVAIQNAYMAARRMNSEGKEA